MKRWPLLLGLLSACQASVVPFGPGEISGPVRRYRSDGRLDRFAAVSTLPLFEFLPGGGAGAPKAQDLCDTLQVADKAGNWWCLNGSGTSTDADGGVVLSAVGSPTTQTRALCSNGLECSDATNQRTEKATPRYFKSGDTTVGTGDQTLCFLASFDGFASEQLLGKWNAGNNADLVFAVDVLTTGQPKWYVTKDGAASSVLTATTALSARSWNFVCGVYDYVTDGTSTITSYLNGAADGTMSTAEGPPRSLSIPFSVGATGNGSTSFASNAAWRGVFWTEKVLSPTDISRLSAAVHGTLTGSKGETMTFARASTQFCENGSGAGTTMRSGQACVAQGGYLSEGAGENHALRSEELDTGAVWTPVGRVVAAPTVTPNATTAPDGTLTAEQVDFAAVSSTGDGSFLSQTIGSVGVPSTSSVWLKGVSGSGSLQVGTYDNIGCAGTNTVAACAFNSTSWARCDVPGFNVSGTRYVVIGYDNECTPDQTVAAQSVYVWGGQHEVSAYATSYIRTEGSTATRVASTMYLTQPSGLLDAVGCAAASYRALGTPPAYARIVGTGAAGTAAPFTAATCTSSAEYDGTNLPTTTHTTMCGSAFVRGVATWSTAANQLSIVVSGSTPATSAYDDTMLGGTTYIGYSGVGDTFLGHIKQVQLSDSLTECK